MLIKYPVYRPYLRGNEKKYVNQCLDSGWISSQGEFVEKFERAFANFVGTDYALSCSNGTTALHLALLALGIKPGDEVILPALTYVATANVVSYVGAVLWGLGNVISTRLRDINMLSLVIWSSFVAILPTFAAALIFESPLQIILHPQQLHGLSFLSLAYITLLSTHFGYTSWSWLCSRYPIAIITPFALLSPIIAVCCSSLLFHESFESWKVLAAFLVLMGLCINLFGQKLFDWSAALVTDSIDFFNTVFNRTDKQEESTFPSD